VSRGGLAAIICMPIVGFLISKLDGRYLFMFEFSSIALARFHMTTTEGNTGRCSINFTSRDEHTGEHP
jgi:hypothetical protein